MKKSKKNLTFNKNVQNVADEMNNIMNLLHDLRLIYYYIPVQPSLIGKNQVITWNNHESNRMNCGESFTTLQQYKHILESGAFQCILFDGSILRSSLVFKDMELKNHSHLWWPAPYNNGDLNEDFTPQLKFEDFLTDPNWMENLRMRSPIRIDFDPSSESIFHPAVHMHTQHHESRIHVDEPMCFSKFIKYIFQNFYPDIELDFGKWNLLKFTYKSPKVSDHVFSSIKV